MLNNDQAACTPQRDLSRRPATAIAWWGIPLALGVSADFLTSSSRVVAVVWVAVFVWMGVGCLLNALRCHRLHCYFMGPVLLLGAVLVGLVGFGEVTLGPHGLSNAINGTVVLALLSFVPEWIWGKYASRH
jgi:hypothetical protein